MMRSIIPAPLAGVEVYDVDSGLGGQFTVSIQKDLDGGMVEVRILQGNLTSSGWLSHGLFDGKIFEVSRLRLTNPRRLE